MIELKAATDLNPTYLREGATKYCVPKYSTFAGCLFLGDGSDDSKINQLSKGGIELLASQKIYDGAGTWLVGLLVTSKS